MREIKFRGFAVEKMVDGQWQYGSGVTHMEFAEEYAQEVGRKADWYVWTESGWVRVHEKSIGQYTGLKDKNGVEIYEGDIVRCTHWFFDGNEVEEEFIASVGFKDGSYTLENINSRFYSDYTREENGAGVCWIGSINYTEDDYEVIGNVFEHPHLLKGE